MTVILICFLWTLPTAGMFISSFRPANAIQSSGWWTVFLHPFELTQWTLQNYGTVLTKDGMADAFINSLIVTIPATVIPITIAAFAAYAFAWMKFPGRDFFFAIVVGLLVVPLHMALIPVLRLYTQFGLNGTFLGIWLAHTGFGLPLAVYLLYNYMSLVIPLSVPAIASFAIFQFLWVWNDLLVALVFLGTSAQVGVVTSTLSELVGSRGQDWHLLTAGAFISMIIPLFVFFSLQRYFIRGLLAGSVKG
jgi:alpha-glucoside transport system permease protein